ncbi:MAG TPA: BMP family ABC transporter substrate-binding protein [Tepidisphaeraceae bacterium]|nr:BMP family ABC transporter substrate-binding protein [Tepidisphaeraceae bacterium]
MKLLTKTFGKSVLVGSLCALALALSGCGKGDESSPQASSSTPAAPGATPAAPAEKPITVGFIYVGSKDDYGYNESHATGADAVKQIPGVTVIEAENIAETKDCEDTMESMINLQNASIIFATSFGYFQPHVLNVAPQYPNVDFLHAGGMWKDGMPQNVGTYFAYIDELEYLCGMTAGMTTKSNKLGYVAAKPIAPVLRDINAFELGAKSVNPKATLTVIFTGDWFMPIAEADAVNSLHNEGVDVVSGHIDSPKVMIETAGKLGMYCCGYHFNGSALAPNYYLTGAEWNWGPMYVKFVNDIRAGKPLPRNVMGSLRDGSVQLSPFGPAVSDATKTAVEAVEKQMMAGTFQMYKGPLLDNKGNTVIPAGKSFDDEDPSLWGMNYLVQGVIGSVGG